MGARYVKLRALLREDCCEDTGADQKSESDGSLAPIQKEDDVADHQHEGNSGENRNYHIEREIEARHRYISMSRVMIGMIRVTPITMS